MTAVPVIMLALRQRDEEMHLDSRNAQEANARLDAADSFIRVQSENGIKEDIRVRGAAQIILRFLRRKTNRDRLHYQNLKSRLKFEGSLISGLVSLSLNILLFCFLIVSSMKASSNSDCKGIHDEIDKSLNLHTLDHIQSSKEFVTEFLPQFADKTRDFQPLSNRYFHAGLDGGAELLSHRQYFERPERLALDINVRQPSFTFTAWVKTSPSFVAGYIIRKRVGAEGKSQDLSCWGWYLSHLHGQQLHYGGHDFYYEHQSVLYRTSTSFHKDQTEVGPKHNNVTASIEPEEDVFLAMVVERDSKWESQEAIQTSSPGNVSFYRNGHLMHTLSLPRPFTDCYNFGEGPSLGDSALQLSQVRFYPFALRASQQYQVMHNGDILQDLVIGSKLLSIQSIDQGNKQIKDDLAETLSLLTQLKQSSEQQEVRDVATLVVSLQQQNLSGNRLLAAAPHGRITPNVSLHHENITGHRYRSLFKGPARLTRPNVLDDADVDNGPRTLHAVPGFRGSGVSFTWWHLHPTQDECLQNDNHDCSVDFLNAHDSSGTLCWSIRVFPNGISFENPKGAKIEDTNFMARHHFLNAALEPKWRHLAVILDESDDSFSLFVDGNLGKKGSWGSAVAQADCENRSITFGRSFPGWTDGLPTGVYDLRMYVSTESPTKGSRSEFVLPAANSLSAANILALANQDVKNLDANDKCVRRPPRVDTLWKDERGRGCDWYALHGSEFRIICQQPKPLEQCPVACGAFQGCFESEASLRQYQLGHRIMSVFPRTSKGSFCIASEGKDMVKVKAQMMADCDSWVKAGRPAPYFDQWSKNFLQSKGRRFDLLNSSSVCQDVVDSIDQSCEFNGTDMQLFTKEVRKNGGDFSISFWVRPVDEYSLIDGQFLPQITFYSSLFPPQHNLVLGTFGQKTWSEVRVHSPCVNRDVSFFESIYAHDPSEDGWTRYTYVRKNATESPNKSQRNTVISNGDVKYEDANWSLCLFDEQNLFSAIEFNYPMYITPFELYPMAIEIDDEQMNYYFSAADMAIRSGPIWPFRQPIHIEQVEYIKRSALVAPPIILQTREKPSQCDFEYSNKWIQLQALHANQKICNMTNHKCAYVHAPMSTCRRSSVNTNSTYFELDELEIDGERMFADMLYSLTDNQRLLREGRLQITEEFVDSYTKVVKVLIILFAPSEGVLALVTIDALLLSPTGIEFSYSIDFFSMLDGKRLDEYLALDCISLILSLVIIAYSFYKTLQKYYKQKKVLDYLQIELLHHDEPVEETSWMPIVLDTLFVMIPISIALRIRTVTHSMTDIEHIIQKWANIDWDNEKVGEDEKKLVFFDGVMQMKKDIAESSDETRLLYFSLLICMLRMLQQTSLHPRLALITGTMSFASEHLWHALTVAMGVMCSFAAVGEMRFGIKHVDFATFGSALASEIRIFFSPAPYDGWELDGDLLIFTVLLLFMLTLLVMNFVLAIIVEAYMQVCKAIEANLVEQSFLKDVLSVLNLLTHQALWRWPWPEELADTLTSRFKVKHSVGYADLEQTKLFPSHRAIVAFLHYYKRFDFCKPEVITKFGKKAQNFEEGIAIEVEKRIATMLGLEPTRLKDLTRRRTRSSNRDSLNAMFSTSATRPMPQLPTSQTRREEHDKHKTTASIPSMGHASDSMITTDRQTECHLPGVIQNGQGLGDLVTDFEHQVDNI